MKNIIKNMIRQKDEYILLFFYFNNNEIVLLKKDLCENQDK